MNDRWDAGSTPGAVSVVEGAAREAAPEAPEGARPERYERREALGVGGMGRVVVARDRVLERDVALKEVAPRADAAANAALEARLGREAALTARLEHPGIVPVYDAGRRPDGGMYYTMRVIRGRSLADAVREAPDQAARLSLMRHVLDACQAVAWAHRHGVVHRDLKPANIMVGEFGETQVVDWGLARTLAGHEAPLVGGPGGDDGALTALGAVVGTPHYMSPEQALGQPADTRSDVWALGFVIVEVATGRAVRGASSAGEALAQARSGQPALELGALPAELAAIVGRATARAPERRYPDAKALAADLAAWLDGRRVGAYSYSTWELVRRVARAWRVPLIVAAVALVVVVLAVGIGFSETAAERDRAEAERARAVEAEARSRDALARAELALGRSLVSEARALAAADERPEAELTAATALMHASSPEARGMLAALDATPRPSRILTVQLPACRRFAPSRDGRLGACAEDGAISVWDLAAGRARWRRAGADPTWVAIIEASGVVLAGVDRDTDVAALDLATGAPRAGQPACCAPMRATTDGDAAIGFAVDRAFVVRGGREPPERRPLGCATSGGGAVDPSSAATFAGCLDGRWFARDAGGVERTGRIAGSDGEHATAAALVPARDEVVVGTNKGRVMRIALTTAEVVAQATGSVGVVSQVLVAPDGGVVALSDERRGVRLWDALTGSWLGRLPARLDRGARWLVDAPRRLAVWSDRELVTWDVPSGRPPALALVGGASGLDLAPGAAHVAVAAGRSVLVHRLSDGARVLSREASAIVKGVSFSADGARVAFGVAGADNPIGLADLEGIDDAPWVGEARFTRRVGRVADRGWLRMPGWGALSLVEGDGSERAFGPDRVFVDLGVAADGVRAALLIAPGGELAALDLAGAPLERAVAADPTWSAVAPANRGDGFACVAPGGVELVDPLGDVVGWLDASGEELFEVVWSPDDRWIAAGGRSGAVWLWRVADRARVAVMRDHHERVAALGFDPEGRWLVSGAWDATLRFTSLAPLEADPAALRAALEAAWGTSYDAIVRE